MIMMIDTTTNITIITIMQVTVGTTAAESMNASANIFLGQSEAPLMIRPYLKVINHQHTFHLQPQCHLYDFFVLIPTPGHDKV